MFLNYVPQSLSRTIEDLKNEYGDDTPIDIKPIPSFDYNVDDKEISSSPSLSIKKENIRHPDCFLWEIKYWVDNEVKIKRIVYPTKWGQSAIEKHINKFTAIDGDTALYGRNRETLAKNVETEIHILNKRQDTRGMNSFPMFSLEISGFLYEGDMDYIKSYEGTAFKVEQNKVWEQLIIEQLNMEILEEFKSKDFKDVKDEDIKKFIQSLSFSAKRIDFYKRIIEGIGKDIPTLCSEMEISTPLWRFLEDLAKDNSIISTWNTLKITKDKDGNILKSEISPFKGIHRSIAFDRYWGSEKKLAENSKIMDGKLLLGNIEFLAVYTLDKYGYYSDGKITDGTPLDRAFRIVNKIKGSEIEYALVEISQDVKRENPEGWFDGVFVSSKGIVKKTQITGSEKVRDYYNAILTENSGHLLSSLFFNPDGIAFITRSESQLKKEEVNDINRYTVTEGGIPFGLKSYKATSWSESNRHLNIIESQNYIVPAFAPSGMKYELPPYKDYLGKLDSFRRSQIQNLEREKIPYKTDSTYPITEIELQRLMFEVLKPSPSQGVSQVILKYSSYATSLLGKLNLRAYESLESPNVYDLSSYRDDSDVGGIASALFSESELQYFLTKNAEGEILSEKDISLKEWMYVIYQKVMGFSQPSTDRISELINEAKRLFEELGEDPIDLSGSYKKIFRNEELDNGRAMLYIIERLFGHATVKYIFAGMIKATKRPQNLGGARPRPLYKIEVLTRPSKGVLSDALKRFLISSPISGPNKIELTPSRAEIGDHLFAIFHQKASLFLPVGGINTEKNRAYLGAMPLKLGGEGFEESFEKYSAFHISEPERLFCDSGYNLVEAICKLYDNYIRQDPKFKDLTETQKQDIYAVFRRDAYQSYFRLAQRYSDNTNTLRLQIADFFNGDKYRVELIIRSYEDTSDPSRETRLWVSRDDFDGVDFIIYGYKLSTIGITRSMINEYFLHRYRIDLDEPSSSLYKMSN